jgi:hypothetical protein
MTMKVWIVFEEWQNGEGGVVGVYATKETADAARRTQEENHAADGRSVWATRINPADDELNEDPDWDVDVHGPEEWDVQP